MVELTVDCVKWKHPPEGLLEYQYCRHKMLKTISTLHYADCPFNVSLWEQKLTNQILFIHAKQDKSLSYLRDIFDEKVYVEASDLKNLSACIGNKEKGQSESDIFKHRVPLAILEMTKNNELTDQSTEHLRVLKQLPRKTYRQIVFYIVEYNGATTNPGMVKEELKEKLDINNVVGNLTKLQRKLHKVTFKLVDGIERKFKERKIETQISTNNRDELQILESASDILANIKRILLAEDKGNVVTEKLQDKFKQMQTRGYVGHVFLHQRLTIYFESAAEQEDVDTACIEARKYFTNVYSCKLSDSSEIKQYTLKHDERAKSTYSRHGRLGAFAKLAPGSETVALSAGHFAQDTDEITVNNFTIGHCIYPSDEYRDILSNDISVIELKNCRVTFMHDDMNEVKERVLMTDSSTPKTYSKVYKGRLDMGFISGTIISTEFVFDGFHGYLIEGDDDIQIARHGDCGTVVKLQKEIDGKLRGVAMIVGGVFKIPNIEEDTTITLPLHRAISKFENDTGNRLSFEV